VKTVLAILSGLYLIGAVLVGLVWFSIFSRLRDAFHADPARAEVAFSSWIPFISFSVIAAVFAIMCCVLAYLLVTRRRRKAALIMAGISCLGIPYGTVVGIATLIIISWPEVRAQFTS
jgi:ABC-type Fe3+ transport system permease subunit